MVCSRKSHPDLGILFLDGFSEHKISLGSKSGSSGLPLRHKPFFSIPLEAAMPGACSARNFYSVSNSLFLNSITACSTSVAQVSIIIIYNFALPSNDVWRTSWMNSDCNCQGYWASSANYCAQMIALKYSLQHTWNKKQLAQLCQWISLLPPMGLRGREAGEKSICTREDKFSMPSLRFPIPISYDRHFHRTFRAGVFCSFIIHFFNGNVRQRS